MNKTKRGVGFVFVCLIIYFFLPKVNAENNSTLNNDAILKEECDKAQAVYSKDRYQYGVFQRCRTVIVDKKKKEYQIIVSVKISELQYYWGSAWYTNDREWTMKNTVELLIDGKVIRTISPDNCHGTGNSQTCSYIFHAHGSANYSAEFDGVLKGMYWKDTDSSSLNVGSKEVPVGQVGPSWDQSWGKIAIALQHYPNDVMVYSFGFDNQMPIKRDDGIKYSLWFDGFVVILPKIQNFTPFLFGDHSIGAWSRCERDSYAKVDGKQQKTEILFPVQAWGSLNSPLVAVSVGFRETRKQLNNNTWLDTRCANNLGYFYDSMNTGQYNGTDEQAGPYPETPNFTNKNGDTYPISTLSFSSGGGFNNEISIQNNIDDESTASRKVFLKYLDKKQPVTMIAGVALSPENPRNYNAIIDSLPSERTKRIGVGSDNLNDRIFIVSVGGDKPLGIIRDELRQFMSTLGADLAIEFFDGPSANVVIRDDENIVLEGEESQENFCQDSGALCFFNGSEQVYPSPGWLGIDYKSYFNPPG